MLLFTILARKHHSPVEPPGCRSSWQHPPHHLQLPHEGSCLISHLEEKWPRVIDCNCAVTGFILAQRGKMQPQDGFWGSSGFWAAQKFRQLSHSGRRILPVRACYWVTNQRLSPTMTQIKNSGTIKPATFNSDDEVSMRIREDKGWHSAAALASPFRGINPEGAGVLEGLSWGREGAQTRKTRCSGSDL